MEQRFKPFVVAWFALVIFSSAMVALAARTQMRTEEALGLREEQGTKLWGGRLSQSPLWVSAPAPMPAATEVGDNKLVITITMDYRLRGMTWLTSYIVGFSADYTLSYRGGQKADLPLAFPLPGRSGEEAPPSKGPSPSRATGMVYDIRVLVDGREPANATYSPADVRWTESFGPAQTKAVHVEYKARGMSQYTYQLPHNTKIRALDAILKVTGAKTIDFPLTCMSPTEKSESPDGWQIAWKAKEIITGMDIGVILPDRESPSKQLTMLTYWGVLFLALYLLTILGAMTLATFNIRPLQIFLAAAGFSIFYPLISYIAHYMPVRPALAICLGIVLALTVNYFRLVANLRFALACPAVALLGLLGFGSVAVLLPAYTGLLLTLGAAVALAVIMQITARGRRQAERGP